MQEKQLRNEGDIYEDVQGEIVDQRTGEIVPRGAPPELKPGILAQVNINQVGTLQIEEKTIEIVSQALNPAEVQIRPDGLVYLPWTWYARRLNDAFGVFQWGMVPQGAPQIKKVDDKTELVVWLHWLVVKGVPVSMAGGETSYRPSNKTMSYGDAIEGARSNSLARNCKYLGMALELWDAEWVKNWKAQYAERVKNPDGNYPEYIWRKKGKSSPPKPKPAATTPQNLHQKAGNGVETQETGKDTPTGAETAQGLAQGYTGNQILANTELVAEIVNLTGKPAPEVCGYVAKLEKGKKFTIGQIVTALKPEEA